MTDKLYIQSAGSSDGMTYVKANVHEHEAHVAPPVGILDVEVLAHELVSSPEGAVVAISGCIRIRDVSAGDVDEGLEVVVARETAGRVQLDKFNGCAVDYLPSDGWRTDTVSLTGRVHNARE